MKNNAVYGLMQGLILFMLSCLVGLALISWMGNIFGFPVRSLFSSEGIRWILRTALANFASTPVLSLILLLMGWGIFRASGFEDVCGKILLFRLQELTVRQRLALRISGFVLFGYLLLILWGVLASGGILLSVTGNLEGSPLLDGWVVWLTFGTSLVSVFFGAITGRFQTWRDWISALIDGVAWGSPGIICLFLGAQIWACFQFIWGEMVIFN